MATTLTADGYVTFNDASQQTKSAVNGLHNYWTNHYSIVQSPQFGPNITYTNSAEWPVGISVSNYYITPPNVLKLYIDSVLVYSTTFSGTAGGSTFMAVVPPGSTYRVEGSTYSWVMLRASQ